MVRAATGGLHELPFTQFNLTAIVVPLIGSYRAAGRQRQPSALYVNRTWGIFPKRPQRPAS
jgi:hypothetical protein